MKFASVILFLAAAGQDACAQMAFPAPKTDPTYQRCGLDYGNKHHFACQDPEFPNCEGGKNGVSWGRCFQRPPAVSLAIDPRYRRCRYDFGNNHFGNNCEDPLYPDCIGGFCYARSTNPMPLDPEAPRPDPTNANCAQDYDGRHHTCKDPVYPVCEGMIHGKQWGRCMSKSTEGYKVLGAPPVKEDVVYENDLIISHNDTDPKIKVYEGDEIEGVESWSDAYHFCLSKGRRLPYRYEWCNGKWNRYVGQDVYGGRVTGSEYKWTAVGDNHAPGTLLQLTDKLDDQGNREVCKSYLEGSGPIYREKNVFNAFCTKPSDCEGGQCDFKCPANTKEGFYPDPNDCQAVCYCSGSDDEGSFWEKVTEDSAEVWDPWCGDSRPLDRDNIPLAGMTGGCKRKEYYVGDKSYCDGTDKRRKLWGKLTDDMLIKNPPKKPKVSTVMCIKSAKFDKSMMHGTCAAAWGDPHISTFDGLRYSCQGHGDHILATSLDSGFELQGKFKTPRDSSIKGATVMTGFHLRTGRPDEPDVEFDISQIHRKWWIDGEPNNLIDFKYSQLGTQTTGTPYLQYYASRGVRMFYYPGSQIQLKITYNFQSFHRLGPYIDIELCLPDDVKSERIIGLLGSPDDSDGNDWMDRSGGELPITDTKWKGAFDYCKENWCIEDTSRNRFHNKFTCDGEYDSTLEDKIKNMDKGSKLYAICGSDPECLMDGMAGGEEVAAHTKRQQENLKIPPKPDPEDEEEVEEEEQKRQLEEEEEEKAPKTPEPTPSPPTKPPTQPPTKAAVAEEKPTPKKGSSSGDPHFKTWLGEKYDYHGECDLVLVSDPSFADGKGLHLHIRTTRVKYFSFISSVALMIGEDILEFDNDAENFLINGEKAEANKKHHKTMLGGFVVRRDPKALSIRLHDGTGRHQLVGAAKIDFHTRKNGFPAVIVDAGSSDIFKNSLGLLGQWNTGRKLGRDGQTEFVINGVEDEEGATAFALEWQVRDTEPPLFKDARFPQFPATCIPPAKKSERLGSSKIRKEAEEACNHWKEDKDDCIFDVMATGDVVVASEGHIVHIE